MFCMQESPMNNDVNYEQMVCQHLVQVASEGVWLLDNDYRTIYVNPALAKMLGVSVGAMKGANFFDYLHHDSKDIGEHYGIDRHPPHRELKFMRKDGSVMWAIFSAVSLADMRGNHIGLLGIVTDISERKTIEEALWHSERRYHAIMQHAADAIVVTDEIGNVVDANRKAEMLFGYGIDEFRCLNFIHLHPAESRRDITATFDRMQKLGEARLVDTQIIRKDGEKVPIDLSCSYVDMDGIRLAQAIMRDIRERKSYEAGLVKRLDELNIMRQMISIRDDEITVLKKRIQDLKRLIGRSGDVES